MTIPPTRMHKTLIGGPGAWRRADFPEPPDWRRPLSPETLAELEQALQTIREQQRDLRSLTSAEFALPAFDAQAAGQLAAVITEPLFSAGGVIDLPEGWLDSCREFLDYFEPKIVEYNDLLSYNHIFIKRTSNIGVISAEDAVAFGLTGPCLRGSGVRFDLRKVLPYDGYEDYDFEVPIGMPGGTEGFPRGVVVGDCWNRYFVRVLEMVQSVRIMRQAMDRLPDGPITAKKLKNLKLPKDEVYVETENPRGQLGFYIAGDGSAIPTRVKARGPSFSNLSISTHLIHDCLLADVPAIIGSIDVVMGEVDR